MENQKKIITVIIKLLVMLLVFIAGYSLSMLTIKHEILIDFNSGAEKEIISIWPLTIRERLIKNNVFSVTGSKIYTENKANWNTSFIFYGPWNVSQSYVGGDVQNSINKMSKWFPFIENKRAGKLKDKFITILNNKGVWAACDYGKMKDDEIVEELWKQRNSTNPNKPQTP